MRYQPNVARRRTALQGPNGFKIWDPADIDRCEKRAQAFWVEIHRMAKGENPEVSDGIRITRPTGHVVGLHHSMTPAGLDVGTHNPDAFRGTCRRRRTHARPRAAGRRRCREHRALLRGRALPLRDRAGHDLDCGPARQGIFYQAHELKDSFTSVFT
jgi:hypothetical protein